MFSDISEVIDIFTREDMENFATQVPDVVWYEFYEWFIPQQKIHGNIINIILLLL